MPLFLDTGHSRPALEINAANCVAIGLVNNMPDAAVEATERQFIDLLRAATPHVVALLQLFDIPEMPRSPAARAALAARYRDIAEIWDTPLDGLIVTGSEPRAGQLADEPYWPSLCAVVDWAREHTASTIWSCLAAHAAVLHADGVERQALPQKRCGIFECRLTTDHPLTRQFAEPLRMPHSRYNDLPERALKAHGYTILSRTAGAGVDSFAKLDGSFFLFFQGHPEYAADTLLREYRRDIGRYLAGERADYPAAPSDYFSVEATALAEAFRARARADRRGELMADFPKDALATGLSDPWRPAALGFYRQWVAFLCARKAARRARGVPMRRTWRDWPAPARWALDGSLR